MDTDFTAVPDWFFTQNGGAGLAWSGAAPVMGCSDWYGNTGGADPNLYRTRYVYDANGRLVSSGIYYYQIEAMDRRVAKRLVVVR